MTNSNSPAGPAPTPRRGGYRSGAGRKATYGEPTTTLRVPVSLKTDVVRLLENHRASKTAPVWHSLPGTWVPDLNAPPLLRPLGLVKVSAGFPSPAEDYEDRSLDINQFLIDKPASTFFFQVKGNSMDSFGIHDGDFLVCDKSIDPKNGDVVVAFLNGERLVKQLQMRAGRVRLVAGHPEYPPLVITAESNFEVWGVVVGRFARLQKARRPA